MSTLGVRRPMRATWPCATKPLVWGRRPLYAVIAATGVVALHLAGHGSGLRSALLLVAGLLVVAFAAGPLLPRGTTRASRGLPAVIASRGLFGAAFACVEMFLPLVLQGETGMSPTVSGLVMMVGALGWVAGSAYSGRHGRPETFPRILRVGSSAPARRHRSSPWRWCPSTTCPWSPGWWPPSGFATMAVGMGLATPLMSTLALDLAPEGRQGDSGAAIQMSDSLGQSIAAGLVGAVFARWFLIDEHTSYLAGFGLARAARAGRDGDRAALRSAAVRTAGRTAPSSPWPGPRGSSAARSRRSSAPWSPRWPAGCGCGCRPRRAP